jgi:hypothetical protein
LCPSFSSWIIVVEKEILLVWRSFLGQIEDELGQLLSNIELEVAAKSLDASEDEMSFGLDIIHVAEGVVHNTNFRCFYNELILTGKCPLERFHEDFINKATNGTFGDNLLILLVKPSLGDPVDVHILL